MRNVVLFIVHRCVKQSYINIEKRKSAGHSTEDAWNLTSLELVKAADVSNSSGFYYNFLN